MSRACQGPLQRSASSRLLDTDKDMAETAARSRSNHVNTDYTPCSYIEHCKARESGNRYLSQAPMHPGSLTLVAVASTGQERYTTIDVSRNRILEIFPPGSASTASTLSDSGDPRSVVEFKGLKSVGISLCRQRPRENHESESSVDITPLCSACGDGNMLREGDPGSHKLT